MVLPNMLTENYIKENKVIVGPILAIENTLDTNNLQSMECNHMIHEDS